MLEPTKKYTSKLGVNYELNLMPVEKSARLLFGLVKKALALFENADFLIEFSKKHGTKNTFALLMQDAEVFSKLLSNIYKAIEKLSTDEYWELVTIATSHCTIKDKSAGYRQIILDQDFTGKLKELNILVYEFIKFNYADFLGESL